MSKKNIKIGGVPEHFNLPWHLLIEDKPVSLQKVNLEWKDFKGGTGAMCKALRTKEIDVAIILTEGIIKDMLAGNPSRIVQTYVQSPLLWGIHVDAKSEIKTVNDLKQKSAAISRYGSGSYLMAYVLASQQNWDLDSLEFKVIKNLEGAVEALTQKEADYFMWEHFTTKPLVDKGIFRRIGDCPTPWPCFVIAVREEIITTHKSEIKVLLDELNMVTSAFKKIENIETIIANRYDQKEEDVKKWLNITKWSQSLLSPKEVENVQNTLLKLRLIAQKLEYNKIIHTIS
ncbi:substrate-binding domain-containing protein [Aquimarina sp. ERC-38]|uniref:substrate-binding domain-containing protein n=1 Tax=Aquimarina sp. ERC-38 TaxID=2949996 RepID=UPI0022472C52|nr:substrate-binding domain-containing protein [Aquimarina sp. ERC-38]UZO80163.1 substrate-binding domain-containing protein [Aquimarina sp. ERC-38]